MFVFLFFFSGISACGFDPKKKKKRIDIHQKLNAFVLTSDFYFYFLFCNSIWIIKTPLKGAMLRCSIDLIAADHSTLKKKVIEIVVFSVFHFWEIGIFQWPYVLLEKSQVVLVVGTQMILHFMICSIVWYLVQKKENKKVIVEMTPRAVFRITGFESKHCLQL